VAFQSFRKPLLEFIGHSSPLPQLALEIVNKPRSINLKGAALKLFQTTFQPPMDRTGFMPACRSQGSKLKVRVKG
jgi:hypothetical protein